MADSKQTLQAEAAKPKPSVSADSKPTELLAALNYRPKGTKSSVSWSKVLQIFIVPLVAVIIFLAILIFFVIGGVNDAFAKIDSINQVQTEIQNTNETIAQLQDLSNSTAETDRNLALVNELAPAGVTEVVNFQQRISDLALVHNLTVSKSQTEEQVLVQGSENPLLGIIEIPSTFNLQGKFFNVQSFIENIKNLEDFVIIGEMEIRVVGDVAPEQLTSTLLDWNLVITLVKYQFQQPNEVNKLAQAYAQVPPTVKVEQDVIDFINQKLIQSNILPQGTELEAL